MAPLPTVFPSAVGEGVEEGATTTVLVNVWGTNNEVDVIGGMMEEEETEEETEVITVDEIVVEFNGGGDCVDDIDIGIDDKGEVELERSLEGTDTESCYMLVCLAMQQFIRSLRVLDEVALKLKLNPSDDEVDEGRTTEDVDRGSVAGLVVLVPMSLSPKVNENSTQYQRMKKNGIDETDGASP